MELRIRIHKNSILSLCIAAYYAILVLDRVRRTLFLDAVIYQQVIRFGTYLLIAIIVLDLIKSSNNIKILIILEIVVVIIFLISRLMDNLGDLDWVSTYTQIAFIYIPLAIAAYNIVDKKKFLYFLHIISLIATPVLIITALLSYNSWDSSYDMALGYFMVFTVLILLADFTVNSQTLVRVVDIVFAAILCLFILFTGSRGPFICVASFIVLELFLSKHYSITRKIIILAILAILAALILINFDNIIIFVSRVSQEMGFDSRSIRLLMQGEAVTHDSGRLEIWSYYMNLINQRPAFGYGVMGGWFYDNMYPHNFFLELLLSFGYPIGIILFVAVVLIMLRGVRCNDRYSSTLAILFVSYCTLLFVSNTYLHVWQFFACLAFCIPQKVKVNTIQTERTMGESIFKKEIL